MPSEYIKALLVWQVLRSILEMPACAGMGGALGIAALRRAQGKLILFYISSSVPPWRNVSRTHKKDTADSPTPDLSGVTPKKQRTSNTK